MYSLFFQFLAESANLVLYAFFVEIADVAILLQLDLKKESC